MDEMKDETRQELSLFLDTRLSVTAVFDRLVNTKVSIGYRRNALIQDCMCETDAGPIDLGHLWLQHAGSLDKVPGLAHGDRITFTARVSSYLGRKDGREIECYGLSHPDDVQILYKPIAMITEAPTPTAQSEVVAVPPRSETSPLVQSKDALKRLMRVNDAAKDVGGIDELIELATALKDLTA